MRRSFRAVTALGLALTFLLCTARPARAWNNCGHMLVDLIAYDDLGATEAGRAQRDALVALLRQHPRFKEDFGDIMPAEVKGTADEGRWIFAHAGTWPDQMRSVKPKAVQDKYHRSKWHYVTNDLPLVGGKPADAAAPESDPAKAADPRDMNALQALNYNQAVLVDVSAPAADRAVALCWVLHLTADLHQPLHNVSLISSRFPAPEGDRGGNSVGVIWDLPQFQARANHASGELLGATRPSSATTRPAPRQPELHGFWDSLPGQTEELLPLAAIEKYVKAIHPRDSFAAELQKTDATDIMHEGVAWSKSTVYAPFLREAVEAADAPGESLAPIVLPDSYIRTAHTVGEERVALAGYRLADRLRRVP